MYSDLAGAISDDYQIEYPDDGVSIKLVYDSNLSWEKTIEKMNATLAKMQSLFANNVVFQALKDWNIDNRFHVEEAAVTPLANIDDSYAKMSIQETNGDPRLMAVPTPASNELTPRFEITNSQIRGYNRFGGGKSHWEGADIPYLVARHEMVLADSTERKKEDDR